MKRMMKVGVSICNEDRTSEVRTVYKNSDDEEEVGNDEVGTIDEESDGGDYLGNDYKVIKHRGV